MTGALICQTVTDHAALTALEPQWCELWRQCSNATPFQSPGWLLPWWRTFAPGELCVPVVRKDGRLVALAPFYREPNANGGRLLPIRISISDYHDVLLAPGCEHDALEALRKHLTEIAPWESLELTELPPDAAALRLDGLSGCQEWTEPASPCPVLPLPEDSDALPGTFRPRKRRELRHDRNVAERLGVVQIAAADAHSAIGTFDSLVELHRARWQTFGEPGVLADSRVQRFHRMAIPGLRKAGLLRLYTLRIGGQTASVYYGFHHRNRAYGYLMGFAPAFARASPGAILLGHAIARAVHEGASEFHFLRGREAYKYGWGARDRRNWRRVFHRIKSHAFAVA